MPLPQSLEELEKIKKACKNMVTTRAITSGIGALVPVPGMDIPVDVALLMELLPSISKKFGLSKEQIDEYDPQLKITIFNLIKNAGLKLVGALITKELIVIILKKVGIRIAAKQVAKYIPFVGQGIAFAISVSAMKYIGNSHANDCYKIAKKIIEETEK